MYRKSFTLAVSASIIDHKSTKKSMIFHETWFMYWMNNNTNNKGETWSVFMRIFPNFHNNYAPEDLWITVSVMQLSIWQVIIIDDAMSLNIYIAIIGTLIWFNTSEKDWCVDNGLATLYFLSNYSTCYTDRRIWDSCEHLIWRAL